MTRTSPSAPLRVRALLVLLVLVALLGRATIANAHDTWLLPASMRVPVGRPVTISLTSGIAFPRDDFAINMTRLVRGDVRLGAETRALSVPVHGERSLRYHWTPAREGIATLVVELAPRTLTLAPTLVSAYLDEIGASAGIRQRWAALRSPRQWRERYVKHAASYVRVGAACGDTSWRTPMGLGLEIVPRTDPTALRAGDSLAVRVLLHGVPRVGFVIAARREGGPIVAFITTDASGDAVIAAPSAGRWLLAGTDLRRATVEGLEWESDFVTTTLAVRAGNARRDCVR